MGAAAFAALISTGQPCIMKPIALILLVLIHGLALADTPLLKDDFSDPHFAARRALRGEWKFANGSATCTQNDDLYKKFKDHGPIIFYDLPHTDAAISFAFKPDAETKNVVFTANGEAGHVFRVVIGQTTGSARAFPPGETDHTSVALGAEPAWKLKPGEWTSIKVDLRGPKAVVKIGEVAKTFEHTSLARAKTNLSIGFSFGTVSVKDWLVMR